MEYYVVLCNVFLEKGTIMMNALRKVFSPKIMHRALEQFGDLSVRDFLLFSMLGIILLTIFVLLQKIREKKIRISNVLSGIVLSVYISVMLQLTLVCRESGSRIGIDLDIFHGLVGPDNDFHWLMIAYVVLNCMLFIPYGFTLSLFSFVNERRGVIQMVLVTLISFSTSLIIEMTQLITQRGYYETQDLLFNTLGGVIGWAVFYVIYHVGASILRKREEK